jgi:hypothetical protein
VVKRPPPPRATTCLSGGRTSTEQASRWTSGDGGRPTQTTMTLASNRRKDPERIDFHPHYRWDRAEATMAEATTFSPLPTIDEVDRLYH